jgi:hypothetical protein
VLNELKKNANKFFAKNIKIDKEKSSISLPEYTMFCDEKFKENISDYKRFVNP